MGFFPLPEGKKIHFETKNRRQFVGSRNRKAQRNSPGFRNSRKEDFRRNRTIIARGQAPAGQKCLEEEEVRLRDRMPGLGASLRYSSISAWMCSNVYNGSENRPPKVRSGCVTDTRVSLCGSFLVHARSTTVLCTQFSQSTERFSALLPQKHNWTHALFPQSPQDFPDDQPYAMALFRYRKSISL